jgi:hypothetical protein
MSRDLVVAGHQQITRVWWDLHRSQFEIFVSTVVVDEISAGSMEESSKRLDLIRNHARLVQSPPEAAELAERCDHRVTGG